MNEVQSIGVIIGWLITVVIPLGIAIYKEIKSKHYKKALILFAEAIEKKEGKGASRKKGTIKSEIKEKVENLAVRGVKKVIDEVVNLIS